jgi:hypothetical protein
MRAQRACLDHTARLISALPGNVLEFGLGNGRTFDHLRERLPTRDIYVFDQTLAAHPGSMPNPDKLFLGNVVDTVPRAVALLGRNTALANIDIGTGDDQAARELVNCLVPALLDLLKPDAVVISGQPIEHSFLVPLPLPMAVEPGRYFLYLRQGEPRKQSIHWHEWRGRTFAVVDK